VEHVTTSISSKLVGTSSPICMRIMLLQPGEAEDEVDTTERKRVCCNLFGGEAFELHLERNNSRDNYFVLVGDYDCSRCDMSNL
jgi:hypothetical protein